MSFFLMLNKRRNFCAQIDGQLESFRCLCLFLSFSFFLFQGFYLVFTSLKQILKKILRTLSKLNNCPSNRSFRIASEFSIRIRFVNEFCKIFVRKFSYPILMKFLQNSCTILSRFLYDSDVRFICDSDEILMKIVNDSFTNLVRI